MKGLISIISAIKNKKEWLTEHAHLFAAAMLVIQPVMDVVSYWFSEFGISNAPTLLMRMAVMAVALLWGYWISDRKRVYWIAAGILALLYAGHAFACMQVGYRDVVGDLSNYIRVAQMPLMMIVFTTCMRRNKRAFSWTLGGASVALLTVWGVEILSLITGTDPSTYDDGSGILGWFYNTNSQSAILSMLLALLLVWLLEHALKGKRYRPAVFWPVAVLGCLALYCLGTRLAYFSIFAVTLGLAVSIFLNRRVLWRYAVGLIALAAVMAALYPFSPMVKHQQNYEAVQQDRQEQTNDVIGDPNTEDPENTQEMEPEAYQELVEKLTPIYEEYVGDFVKVFGAEETMRMYNYTTDTFAFSNVRQKKLMFAEALMQNSPVSARFFGVELSRFTVNGNIYDVENDFHGIYCLYGYAGLAVYLLFLLYFVGLIIWVLIKNAKRYFTLEAAAHGIALAVCVLHVYNTAGVLRRPNASIYLSLILAGIYYLVRIRNYDGEKPALPQE